jgi:hypothetical protein
MLRQDKSFVWGISALILALISVPFLIAKYELASSVPDHVFTGLLFNPLDGHTYLAKMELGRQGAWWFWLPYTADESAGAFINMYYVFLGHLGRITGWSNPFVFHLARLAGTAYMLHMLFRMFRLGLGQSRLYRRAFIFAAFGSGMGWLVVLSGAITSDLWVAEVYPLLSALTNAHFPLGLGLIFYLLTPQGPDEPRHFFFKAAGWAAAAIILALVSPFGVVVALLALGGLMAWDLIHFLQGGDLSWQKLRRLPGLSRILVIVLGGGPILIYDLLAIRADAVLAGWDAQNVTLSPPWWDLAVALMPFIALALYALPDALRSPKPAVRMYVVWAGLSLLMLAVPVALQRRFLMGIFVPLVGLASIGIDKLARGRIKIARRLTLAALLLVFPTVLILFLGVLSAIGRPVPAIYMSREEAAVYDWLAGHAEVGSIVLASSDIALRAPAHAAVRVIYGHPFESVPAAENEALVRDFYEHGASSPIFERWTVDYIIFGPADLAGGPGPEGLGWPIAFEDGDFLILADPEIQP